ncbi:MAG TPA: hypothetical protein VD788_13025 [Candidatus Polarisedimenticolaceae bacterium]|nr:hypothetical protein [Candidatus Polarisedimenticolaceae bacterium]
MRRLSIGFIVMACCFCLTAAAADRWVHIRVQNLDGEDGSISVNVPLHMLESWLPTIDIDDFDDLDWEIGRHRGDSRIDLRQLAAALRDAPDGEFVRIRGRDDERVRVAKDEGYLIAEVDETNGDRVRVRLPMSVVEAIVDGGSERIDVPAVLRALADHGDEDLVTVESADGTVRIWIDDRASGD